MKPIYRILILLEVVLCFGPATIMLALGSLFIPATILGVSSIQAQSILLLLPIVGGALGLVALICIVLHIFNPTKGYIKPAKMRVFILCGLFAIISSFLMLGGNKYGWVFYLLPILGTLHLTYLGRAYVFRYS